MEIFVSIGGPSHCIVMPVLVCGHKSQIYRYALCYAVYVSLLLSAYLWYRENEFTFVDGAIKKGNNRLFKLKVSHGRDVVQGRAFGLYLDFPMMQSLVNALKILSR